MKILGPVTVSVIWEQISEIWPQNKSQPDNPALMYTERALLSCHTTNIFMLTNLA